MRDALKETFLSKACGDDHELRRAVDQLLQMQDSVTVASTDRACVDHEAQTIPATRIAAGTSIDDFRIIKQLGEGAMGVVLLAEQQNPKRRVALKLLRVDAMSQKREQRFEYETESLAKLHHPGIATIYKSGRADVNGIPRPFFAMEMVDGKQLDVFTASIDARERIIMIASICDAIEHAHRRGVIHRDLKPANIVVGIDGRARILDFGVATSMDSGACSPDLVGTLPYMSPEQLRSDPNIDGRADVYAIGVILCEVMTGKRPHELAGLSVDFAIKRVAQHAVIDSNRVDHEVEAIIRKAIAPAREDRYGSALEMRDDLSNYLEHRVVTAADNGKAYRSRKFVQRNQTPVLLAALAGLMTIIGIAGVSYQAARATKGWHQADIETLRTAEALEQAMAQQRRAVSVNRFMIEMLVSGDPELTLGEDLTVVEMIDTAAMTLNSELVEYPETVAGVRMALANTYRSLGRIEEARHQAEQMVRLCTERIGDDHTITSDAKRTLALILFDYSEYDQAKRLLDEAAPAVHELNDPIESAKLSSEYARVAHGSGDHTRSFELWTQAEKVLAHELGNDHKDTLIMMNNRGMALKDLGKLAESEAVLQQVYERRLHAFGADHPQTLVAQDVYAGVIQKQGRDAEASAMFRDVLERRVRVLGNEHISTLLSKGNLGVTLIRLGELDEAEQLTREALDGHMTRFGEEHTRTLILMGNLAYLLEDTGKTDEAASLYLKTIEIRRRSEGGLDPETWSTMNNLAMLFIASNRPEEAEPLFDELLAQCDAELPAGHYYTALFRNNHAQCLMDLGKLEAARSAVERSHPVIEQTFGPNHARTIKSNTRIQRLRSLESSTTVN